MQTKAAKITPLSLAKIKVQDYAALGKLRLASLVVFSAVLGYLFAAETVSVTKLLALILGGFLVTASSNGFNQILEKDTDKLMKRTQNRPLARDSMNQWEAFLFSTLTGVIGIALLWVLCNPLSGILGSLALFVYAGIYTPMKKVSPMAVFVGAFPGAVPPMLGYIAETGSFGLIPGLFFAIQFMWQFPHFWAIAWKLDEDYRKAGFYLLPFRSGKNKASAFQILLYTVVLIPVSLSLYYFNIVNGYAAAVIGLSGALFLVEAVKLFSQMDDKSALRLMFASFFYLPIVQIAILLGKQ